MVASLTRISFNLLVLLLALGSEAQCQSQFEQAHALLADLDRLQNDYDPRAQLKERDYAGTGKWTLRAPMLALSNPDQALAFPQGTTLQPQLLVRNTTSKPIDSSLTFNWRTNTTTGQSPASALHLNPNETRRIDVAALQDGKMLPQNAQWASVTLATSGNNAGAIYVDNAGEDSNKEDFYVQVPTSLSIITPKTGSEGPCNNGAWCGTAVAFTYQVNDQASPAQPINASMSFWDSFGTVSPDPLQIDANGGFITTCSASGEPNSGPCNKFTLSNGQFIEQAIGACSPVCIANGACTTGGPSDVNQTWHIASSSIVQQISIYCQKVLINGQ